MKTNLVNYQPSGKHALLDGRGVSFDTLNDGLLLSKLLAKAATEAGATVLSSSYEQFEPQGVSVACILSESHITIHTYPECGVFMADIFTCGEQCDPGKAARYLARELGCTDFNIKVLTRGLDGQKKIHKTIAKVVPV